MMIQRETLPGLHSSFSSWPIIVLRASTRMWVSMPCSLLCFSPTGKGPVDWIVQANSEVMPVVQPVEKLENAQNKGKIHYVFEFGSLMACLRRCSSRQKILFFCHLSFQFWVYRFFCCFFLGGRGVAYCINPIQGDLESPLDERHGRHRHSALCIGLVRQDPIPPPGAPREFQIPDALGSHALPTKLPGAPS